LNEKDFGKELKIFREKEKNLYVFKRIIKSADGTFIQ
jgi:hypothetical protein